MRRARWRIDIEEDERRRAGCPKAIAMALRFRAALDNWPRHHRIENGLVQLGHDIDRGRELLPEEEAHFEKILAEVEAALSSGVPA